jgi:hypothetical protein
MTIAAAIAARNHTEPTKSAATATANRATLRASAYCEATRDAPVAERSPVTAYPRLTPALATVTAAQTQKAMLTWA